VWPFALAFAGLPLILALGAELQSAVRPVDLYRDPLQVADLRVERLRLEGGGPESYCCPAWFGALSTVGVCAWAAAAGSLLVAWLASLARSAEHPRGTGRGIRGLLFVAGLLSALLAADDALQIHEQSYLATLFAGGIKGEWVLLPLYALAGLAYLASWSELRRPYTGLWVAAVAFLASSVLVDQVPALVSQGSSLEDVLKLFGIFLWLGFHTMLALEEAAGQRIFVSRPRGGTPASVIAP
jgi:hypothetical protein